MLLPLPGRFLFAQSEFFVTIKLKCHNYTGVSVPQGMSLNPRKIEIKITDLGDNAPPTLHVHVLLI